MGFVDKPEVEFWSPCPIVSRSLPRSGGAISEVPTNLYWVDKDTNACAVAYVASTVVNLLIEY